MLSAVGRDYGAIGYRIDGQRLMVAFADPPDAEDVQALSGILGYEIVPVLGDPMAIERILRAATTQSDGSSNGAGPADSPSPGTNGSEQGAVSVTSEPTMPMHLDDLLRYASNVGASDLHLTAGMPGCIRLHGAVRPIEGCPQLDNETIREMIFGVLNSGVARRNSRRRKNLTPRTRSPGWDGSG